MGYRLIYGILKTQREKAIQRYEALMMMVSGSMMLPVSQALSIYIGGASLTEEDLVPNMGDEIDGEKEKSSSFCRLLVIN
ncbi:hypothetical protein IGI04_036996 [Brassica rapa subsp. trilocularis]|uniref:Uncharacterized protein n=1 Tax=Brassica rapa subsp. trilocularis TaxID=1813537 RepID=A0ABQ7LIB4_BRACM|nr:hypothetical protein IGI04_036996 [Brassica rapa subsp. trilocularis]